MLHQEMSQSHPSNQTATKIIYDNYHILEALTESDQTYNELNEELQKKLATIDFKETAGGGDLYGTTKSGTVFLGNGAFGFTVLEYHLASTSYRTDGEDRCHVKKYFLDGNDREMVLYLKSLLSVFKTQLNLVESFRVLDDSHFTVPVGMTNNGRSLSIYQLSEIETQQKIKTHNYQLLDHKEGDAWVLAMYADFISKCVVQDGTIEMPLCYGLELRQGNLNFKDSPLAVKEDYNYNNSLNQSGEDQSLSKEKLLHDVQLCCEFYHINLLQHMDLHIGNIMIYQPPIKFFGLKANKVLYRFNPRVPYIFLPIDYGLMMKVGENVKAYNVTLCCSHMPQDGTVGECCDTTALSKLADQLGVKFKPLNYTYQMLKNHEKLLRDREESLCNKQQ